MPAYHCGSEVEAAHLAGIELDFYRVDAQLRVDEEDLARAAAACDATYLISCFGFPMPEPPTGTRVIEDAAHGLFSRDGAGRPLGARGDAAVFCPRKSLGTPDGGAVLLREEGRWIDAAAGRPERRAMARSVASLVAGRAAIAAAAHPARARRRGHRPRQPHRCGGARGHAHRDGDRRMGPGARRPRRRGAFARRG